MNRALRWLLRASAITALGGVGVVLWPANDLEPATAAEKLAARQKIRCRDDVCEALLLAPAGQCGALVLGIDPAAEAASSCPGDTGFSLPPSGQRLRRLLSCAVRDGAMSSWVALYPPGQVSGQCGVHISLTRPQARAWIERLDASTSTALVSAKLADMPASLKRGGGRWHVFAGQDPMDDTDDSAGLENESVDAGP